MKKIDTIKSEIIKNNYLPLYITLSSFYEVEVKELKNVSEIISIDYQTDNYFKKKFYKPIEIYETSL